ncbi:MAG: AAA family ATPase [Deltaproteobacteria bacterium]|nr:AAA family ATPase [Deltaproteobacteria bacterium]
MSNVATAAEHVRQALAQACRGLVQRESLAELVVLCAVAREHLLVVGPPGTAKSEAVRRIVRRLGGQYFEYLIGRFTEPSEIFGPVNLRKLREGTVETETAGMLPEADIAFLDEVFLGSTAILNTLLGILNERIFRRGHTHLHCPLRVCVGASNRLPEDEQLAAFADRFLVRVFAQPIGDSGLEDLLSSGWSLAQAAPPAPTTADGEAPPAPGGERSLMAELDTLTLAARAMDLTPLRPAVAHCVRLVRSAGIELSDRRIVRMQGLIVAAAALAGRNTPTEADLWAIVFALPTEQAQQLGRDVLRDFLAATENNSLPSASAEGSLGARARGLRILRDGTAVIDAVPQEEDARVPWRLRIEGIGREIDATFASDALPPELAALRARVAAVLSADAA